MTIRRRLVGVAAVALVSGGPLLAGCSSTPESSAPVTVPAHHQSTMVAPSAGVKCAQHMPGDVLSASEAMVVFDREHVCLGYVTIAAGTPVMWHNADAGPALVTVVDADGRTVDEIHVDGQGMATSTHAAAGVYTFRLSTIESFTGTIEVQGS